MRNIRRTEDEFYATHKGCEIRINREEDWDGQGSGAFYIQVQVLGCGHLYDGWSPEGVETMDAAVAEALRGSLLDQRKQT